MIYILDCYIQHGSITPWRDPMISCHYSSIEVSNTGRKSNWSVNTNHSSVWIDHKVVLRPAISQRVGHPSIDSMVCIRGRNGVIISDSSSNWQSFVSKNISHTKDGLMIVDVKYVDSESSKGFRVYVRGMIASDAENVLVCNIKIQLGGGSNFHHARIKVYSEGITSLYRICKATSLQWNRFISKGRTKVQVYSSHFDNFLPRFGVRILKDINSVVFLLISGGRIIDILDINVEQHFCSSLRVTKIKCMDS